MPPEKIIPPFRTEFTEVEIAEVTNATEQIMKSGRLVLGAYTEEFESHMAEISQRQHAVAVNSGSSALEIVYKALETKNREVLIPTNTNFATAAAAVNAGADIKFYDNGIYADINSIDEHLTEGKTAAVVVVHIGGYITPSMLSLAEKCTNLGIPLIEDAAHAHGASLGSKMAGSFGDAAAFSFFPTKTLTTGEGGMVTMDDRVLATKARQYRDQGKNPDGITHEVWGNSWRMTEIGAAFGTAQIKSLRSDNKRRAEIINYYEESLGDTCLEFPELPFDSEPSGYKSIALLPKDTSRSDLKAKLETKGIMLGKEVYEKPLHKQPVFEEYVGNREYPVANDFASRHICLPLWRSITMQDVDTVIEELRRELS